MGIEDVTNVAGMGNEDETKDVEEEMADDTPPPDWLAAAAKLLESPEEDDVIGLQSGDQSIPANQSDAEDEEDDGPPPGWESVPIKTEEQGTEASIGSQPSPSMKPVEDAEAAVVEEEGEGEEEGPPPGWESIPVKKESEIISGSQSLPVKEEEFEDGPPPGWQSLPPHSGSQSVSVKEEEPPDWQSLPPPPPFRSAVEPPRPPQRTPAAPSIPSKEESEIFSGSQSISGKEEELGDGPPPGWQSLPPLPTVAPPRPPQLTPAAPTPPPPSDKGQMVCGSCHRLLFYPRGARYVQCSCCTTVNLVLEEHQVGQVKCGSCAVLLMYPYGAPAVKCSSCHFVTEVGVHNNRPPLSMQQRRPPTHPHPVQHPQPPLPNPVH